MRQESIDPCCRQKRTPILKIEKKNVFSLGCNRHLSVSVVFFFLSRSSKYIRYPAE